MLEKEESEAERWFVGRGIGEGGKCGGAGLEGTNRGRGKVGGRCSEACWGSAMAGSNREVTVRVSRGKPRRSHVHGRVHRVAASAAAHRVGRSRARLLCRGGAAGRSAISVDQVGGDSFEFTQRRMLDVRAD